MNGTYLIILAVVIASAVNARRPRFTRSVPPAAVHFGIPVVCITLCVLFAHQLAVITASAMGQPSLSPQLRELFPIVPQEAGFLYRGQVTNRDALALDTLKVAQAIALLLLGVLVASAGKRSRAYIIVCVAVSAVTLAALAFLAPATASADLYSYAGLAQTATPYHPSAESLPGDMTIVNKVWGRPLVPSPYGPLWLALTKVTLAPLPTLALKLFALRGIEVAALTICLALLAISKRSLLLIALVAVNPVVYDLFVAEGHNDLLGAACVFGAAAMLRRAPLIAILLAACAGLIKLPYALIAPLAFVAEPTLFRRIAYGFLSLALTLAVSVAAGGAAYWPALQRVHQLYASAVTPVELVVHLCVALAAGGTILATVLVRRFAPGAAWLQLGLGALTFPWYLAWCFPYALLADEPDFMFLAMLPVGSLLLNAASPATPIFYAVWLFVLGSAVFAIVMRWRHGSSAGTRTETPLRSRDKHSGPRDA